MLYSARSASHDSASKTIAGSGGTTIFPIAGYCQNIDQKFRTEPIFHSQRVRYNNPQQSTAGNTYKTIEIHSSGGRVYKPAKGHHFASSNTQFKCTRKKSPLVRTQDCRVCESTSIFLRGVDTRTRYAGHFVNLLRLKVGHKGLRWPSPFALQKMRSMSECTTLNPLHKVTLD